MNQVCFQQDVLNKHDKLIWEYVTRGESRDPNRVYLTVNPKIFVA